MVNCRECDTEHWDRNIDQRNSREQRELHVDGDSDRHVGDSNVHKYLSKGGSDLEPLLYYQWAGSRVRLGIERIYSER